MKTKLFGTVCVLSALAVVACGDDESGEGGSGGSTTTSNATGNNTKSTSTGGTTKATSATTGGMDCPLPGVADPTTCDTACDALYECGALTCNGATICAFTGAPAEKMGFVETCIESCMGQMALISVIDPTDCQGTVDTISNLNAQFAMSCTDGIMGAGGGN